MPEPDKSIVVAEIDEIKWQSNTGQSILKSNGFYQTSGHFTGLVHCSDGISFSLPWVSLQNRTGLLNIIILWVSLQNRPVLIILGAVFSPLNWFLLHLVTLFLWPSIFLIKWLGTIRAKIGPTSDVDKIFSKIYSQYVLFRNKYS